MECARTVQAMETAIGIARGGSTIGFVGVPHGVELPVEQCSSGRSVCAGAAPRCASTCPLLDDVLDGLINPRRGLDYGASATPACSPSRRWRRQRAIRGVAHRRARRPGRRRRHPRPRDAGAAASQLSRGPERTRAVSYYPRACCTLAMFMSSGDARRKSVQRPQSLPPGRILRVRSAHEPWRNQWRPEP
jgi:hypothetical protein